MKKAFVYVMFFGFVFVAGMMVGTADFTTDGSAIGAPQMATMGSSTPRVSRLPGGKQGTTLIIRLPEQQAHQ